MATPFSSGRHRALFYWESSFIAPTLASLFNSRSLYEADLQIEATERKRDFLDRAGASYGYCNSPAGFIDKWRGVELPGLLPPLGCSSGVHLPVVYYAASIAVLASLAASTSSLWQCSSCTGRETPDPPLNENSISLRVLLAYRSY